MFSMVLECNQTRGPVYHDSWATIAVLNIKVLVPVILDCVANNYTRWRALFLVILGKYALTNQILTDEVNTDRPAWMQMDYTVPT
jgi:hypothetical protein